MVEVEATLKLVDLDGEGFRIGDLAVKDFDGDPAAVGTEDAIEADPAGGAQRRGDVTVRQAAGDGEGVAQVFDMGGRPVGEIAQGALTDAAVLAVALAQQDRRQRIPVRDGFDIGGRS
jgi:hypothetical protein